MKSQRQETFLWYDTKNKKHLICDMKKVTFRCIKFAKYIMILSKFHQSTLKSRLIIYNNLAEAL